MPAERATALLRSATLLHINALGGAVTVGLGALFPNSTMNGMNGPVTEGVAFWSVLPWVAAAAAIVAGERLRAFLTWIVNTVSGRIYSSFAGTRLFRRTALRKYTSAVYREYGSFAVPFVDNLRLPMREVYVPLAADLPGTADSMARDADRAVREAHRSVVIGVPGAGKSMLLRQRMFAWADKHCTEIEPRRGAPWNRAAVADGGTGSGTARPPRLRVRLTGLSEITVLVELKRLNDANADLTREIVAHLDRNGFPNAGRFVDRALKGRLTVLLDGLDEVAGDRQSAVVRQILDFAERNNECRLVVTCREAVYQGQLGARFDRTLRVAELDERLIRQYLRGWPDLRRDGRVDHLMAALGETPQLMQLARNPLLLAMIAYLHTHTATGDDRTLPHTRAGFYRQATDDLLEQRWHPDQNRFQGPKKKAVLQRLALLAHDGHGADDRLTLSSEIVLAEIRVKLPSLNLDAAAAEDLLNEIITRSGLLLRIDGGERYQFAHLTLQEYLAAVALHSDADGLLERHEKEPDRWREVVRLWCGSVSQDSGAVISRIYERDQVLAFECLAEAQDVRDDLADAIIQGFEDNLDDTPQVVAAFGLVASDRRPRGRAVLAFLIDTLDEQWATPRGLAAAAALGATRLPQAASVLARCLSTLPEVEPCLAAMGDIAVAALARPVPRTNDLNTARILGNIGTPAAMTALVPFLNGISEASTTAAMHLAAGLADEEVANALRRAPLPDGKTMAGVWSAFAQGEDDALAAIAGRVAWILDHTVVSRPFSGPYLDPRIAIPLCSVQLLSEWTVPPSVVVSSSLAMFVDSLPDSVKDNIERGVSDRLKARDTVTTAFIVSVLARLRRDESESPATLQAEFAHHALECAGMPRRRLAILDGVRPDTRAEIALRILAGDFGNATIRDWMEVRRIPTYRFATGWHLRLIMVIELLMVISGFSAALATMTGGLHASAPAWLGWGASGAIALGLAAILTEGFFDGPDEWMEGIRDPHAGSTLYEFAVNPVPLAYLTGDYGLDDLRDYLGALSILLVTPMTVTYLFVLLHAFANVFVSILVLLLIATSIFALRRAGIRRDRAARNPFDGLLNE